MKECKNCQSSFNIREEDKVFYQKFDVPVPAICPDCRLQQRLAFRNERTLYQRTSSLSGKKMISIYHQDCKYPVYTTEEWWSDQWDGLDHGQDFDFSRPFFDQFQELLLKIPRISLFNVNPSNSDYCQQAYNNKNCYLCMVITDCEDSMYLSHTNHAKDSFDCTYIHHLELCYECLDSNNLYGCVSCQSCQNSSGLTYCYDCIGCQDCFGCWSLRNKKYHIFNKPYSKEEYQEKITSLQLHKRSQFLKYKKYFADLMKDRVHRASRNLNSVDSTGNYLINTQNCFECFDSFQIEDCAYCTWIFESHHCYDAYGLGGSEWVLDCIGNEHVNHVAFNTFVSDSHDVFYSDLCFYSHDLFGCAGLKNKQYCILNKQYSKEEYEAVKAKIIDHMKESGEWGRFFPVSLSPFAYNETAVQNYFPLSREGALAKGFRWKAPDKKDYRPQSYTIPDDIQEVQPDITEAILSCECGNCRLHSGTCGKNYRILLQELKFYRDRLLPVPTKCPDCRYDNRLTLRNPRQLFARQCDKCKKEIQTSYAPDRPEKVVCEECYMEEVS